MNIIGRSFQILLEATGRMALIPALKPANRVLLRRLADLTWIIKGGRRKGILGEIGQEWQRMFPSRKLVPITDSTEDTVYAEVRARCPLVGSGDATACYHLMEYDRRLLERIGGEFVVLESRADRGIPACRVAIRAQGAPLEDLTPAHVREG